MTKGKSLNGVISDLEFLVHRVWEETWPPLRRPRKTPHVPRVTVESSWFLLAALPILATTSIVTWPACVLPPWPRTQPHRREANKHELKSFSDGGFEVSGEGFIDITLGSIVIDSDLISTSSVLCLDSTTGLHNSRVVKEIVPF